MFFLTVTPLLCTAAEPPTEIEIGKAIAEPFHGTTHIGLNLEMALTSDKMWNADHCWMERTFAELGIKAMRWGYSAIWWDAIREKPLTQNYWSAENTPDALGSFGFKQFVDYCLRSQTTPFIMLPVDSLAAGVPMEKVTALSREMTECLSQQSWQTPVYLELGNEPYTKPSLTKEQYAAAIKVISPGSFVFSVEWNSREGRDFKFACDKIEHGDKVSIGSIPSGFTLGSREDAAEAF